MITYRKATASDLDTLIQLRLDYLAEDRGFRSETEKSAVAAQLKEYIPKHIGDDFVAWFAETEGSVVAVAFLVIDERPANLSFITGRIGTVLNVLTYAQYRGQGIATQLLKRLVEEAKSRRLSYIKLSATEAGRPLYEKLGFVETQSHYTEMKYQLQY